MYTWLIPWLYLAVVGFCYYVLGNRRDAVRRWVVDQRNTWLALDVILAALGVAGTIFWRARWLHVIAWLAFLAVCAWTIHRAKTSQNESTDDGFPSEQI